MNVFNIISGTSERDSRRANEVTWKCSTGEAHFVDSCVWTIIFVKTESQNLYDKFKLQKLLFPKIANVGQCSSVSIRYLCFFF